MKNIIYFIGGGLTAQLATILASPILSRLYSPEEFGLFALVTSTIYFINAFSLARLEIELLSCSNSKDDLRRYALGSLSIITVFCSLCFYFFFNFENKFIYLFFPFLIFLSGYYNLSYYDLLSDAKISKINLSKVTLAVSVALAQILLGALDFGSDGLIIGHLIGFLISILIMGNYFWKVKFKFFFAKFKKNIFVDAPAASLTILSNHLPTYLIFFFLGESISGAYFMAFRLLITPIAFISDGISNYISTKFRSWKTYEDQERIFYMLILFSLIPFLVICFYIDFILLFFLGEQWVIASIIASIILYWVYLKLFFDSFLINFSLIGAYSVNLLYQTIGLIVKILSILIPSLLGYNWFQVILGFSFVSILWYVVGILTLSYLLKFNLSRVLLIASLYMVFIFIKFFVGEYPYGYLV
ncbi:lipopolysaccharide biosynthesis protein [Frederiksenia canicola]